MNPNKFKPLYLVTNEDGIIHGAGTSQQEAFAMAQASYHLNHIESCENTDCDCEIETVDELLSMEYTIEIVYYIPEDGL